MKLGKGAAGAAALLGLAVSCAALSPEYAYQSCLEEAGDDASAQEACETEKSEREARAARRAAERERRARENRETNGGGGGRTPSSY